MTDAQVSRSLFKKSRNVPLTVGEAVGEFKTVVNLDAFHPDAPSCVLFHQLFQEIGGEIGGLLRIRRQKTQTGKFVNGGILRTAALGQQCSIGGLPSRLSGPAVRDRSSADKALAYRCSSAWTSGTSPVSA